MKRILRTIIGAIITICGLAIALFTGYQATKGNLEWLLVTLAGVALAATGVRIARGDRMRDILRDLLFVLVRAH